MAAPPSWRYLPGIYQGDLEADPSHPLRVLLDWLVKNIIEIEGLGADSSLFDPEGALFESAPPEELTPS